MLSMSLEAQASEVKHAMFDVRQVCLFFLICSFISKIVLISSLHPTFYPEIIIWEFETF